MNEMKRSDAAVAFGVGLLVGAGVTMLLAPRSGKKTRDRIEGFARDTLDEGRRLIDEAQGRLKDQADRVRSALKEGGEAFARDLPKA